MKYMVSLNGKQYEVIVERGTVTGTPVGAAPAGSGCRTGPSSGRR